MSTGSIRGRSIPDLVSDHVLHGFDHQVPFGPHVIEVKSAPLSDLLIPEFAGYSPRNLLLHLGVSQVKTFSFKDNKLAIDLHSHISLG